MPFTVEVVGAERSGQFVNLTYTYKGEEGVRKLPLFGPHKEIAQAALTWSPGSKISVSTEKNNKGFNEWVSAEGVGADGGNSQSGGNSMASGTRSARSKDSSYPTKEERDATQVMIVRQSTLAVASRIRASQGKPFGVDEVIDDAEKLTQWVMDTKLTLSE